MNNWTRIPVNIPRESDRRTLITILADQPSNPEVRIKKVKINTRYNWFIECREQDKEEEAA